MRASASIRTTPLQALLLVCCTSAAASNGSDLIHSIFYSKVAVHVLSNDTTWLQDGILLAYNDSATFYFTVDDPGHNCHVCTPFITCP